MSYQNILLDRDEESGIATLTINRPDVLNALDGDTYDEIGAAVGEIAGDAAIRILIVTGAGRAFVAGADIAYLRTQSGAEARRNSLKCNQIVRGLELLEIPVIAAVNGPALGGGCELALACDIRLASEGAVLGLPEVSLGVMPGCGGTLRLPQLIGAGRAKELIFAAARVTAEEAYRLGLINHVYPAETLMDEAKKLALRILKNAPRSVAFAKCAIDQGLRMDLSPAMRVEAEMFGLCCGTEDKYEGTSAFLEKRKPVFQGK